MDDQPERITNGFVRNHFMWDRMDEVDWALVENNLAAAHRILGNPDKFPRANFDYLENQALELECFLLAKPMRVFA